MPLTTDYARQARTLKVFPVLTGPSRRNAARNGIDGGDHGGHGDLLSDVRDGDGVI